ncbi:hypothetical protein [Oceanobacillus sp. AG]|uniref:hypothetical protein n=2 Tax=Oceanobacillus TaxID=182709 RepID=UPI001E42B3F3|nr:hypothetical protein [Oceanobacillus sp. AG]
MKFHFIVSYTIKKEEISTMKENEGVYAIIITCLILIAFVVPYTLLPDVEKWYGSFLFWTVLTVIVIGVNYLLIREWGKKQ